MLWHTQVYNITNNLKVKRDLTLLELIYKNVTWNYYVYDSAKGSSDMILGIYLITALGIDIKLSEMLI